MTTLEERSAERRRRIVGNRAKSFAEAEAWDLEYWQSKTPEERLSALVAIRRDIELAKAARPETDGKERRPPGDRAGDKTAGVTIPNEVLEAAHMDESELRQELAILLFQKSRLTLAQAARLAELDRLRFQRLLAARDIPLHYDVEDFESDLETLRSLNPE
jgi:predicted HTH domain antitoxin